MCVLPVCVYVYYVCDWRPRRSEEKVGCPGTGVAGHHVGTGSEPGSSAKATGALSVLHH